MVQLNELFGNKELINILEFLIQHPTSEYSQTELRLKTKTAKATIVKWAKVLDKENIVSFKKIGTSKIYRLNYKSMIIKQFQILRTLLQLEPLKKIKADIFLYGSAARGENIEDSDIDLIIIGKLNRKEIIEEIDNLSKKINKHISFKIFNNKEWSMLARTDRAFYERVEKDKIKIE